MDGGEEDGPGPEAEDRRVGESDLGESPHFLVCAMRGADLFSFSETRRGKNCASGTTFIRSPFQAIICTGICCSSASRAKTCSSPSAKVPSLTLRSSQTTEAGGRGGGPRSGQCSIAGRREHPHSHPMNLNISLIYASLRDTKITTRQNKIKQDRPPGLKTRRGGDTRLPCPSPTRPSRPPSPSLRRRSQRTSGR